MVMYFLDLSMKEYRASESDGLELGCIGPAFLQHDFPGYGYRTVQGVGDSGKAHDNGWIYQQ